MGRLVDTTRRAGVEIRCVAADLEAAPIRPAGVAAVLVDAPCSATGTNAGAIPTRAGGSSRRSFRGPQRGKRSCWPPRRRSWGPEGS